MVRLADFQTGSVKVEYSPTGSQGNRDENVEIAIRPLTCLMKN